MDAENEPQSVADASAALAKVGFNADLLEGAGDPAEPQGVAAQQQASGVAAPAAPAAPSQPAGTGASDSTVTPPATPAGGAPLSEAEQAYAAWKANDEAQRAAFAIQQGLGTEAGVRLIVAQGLTALGKDPAVVRAFMEGRLTEAQAQATAPAAAPVVPANPWDNLTEDDVIDGEQFKQYAAEVQRQAIAAAQTAFAQQQQPVVEAVRAEQQTRAAAVTDQTLVELLGEGGDPTTVDKELARKVLDAANTYVDPNNWESGHIRAAIIQGHHDVVKIAEAAQRAYLNRKELVAATVPQTTGGAQASGTDAAPEPKNLKDASSLAKELYPDLFK